jgi:hypothetical protein
VQAELVINSNGVVPIEISEYTLSLDGFSELLNSAPVNSAALSGGVYLLGLGSGPYSVCYQPFTGTPAQNLPPLEVVNEVIADALVNSSPSYGGIYFGGSNPSALYFQQYTGITPPGVISLQVLNSVLATVPVGEAPVGGGLYLIGSGPYQVCFEPLS